MKNFFKFEKSRGRHIFSGTPILIREVLEKPWQVPALSSWKIWQKSPPMRMNTGEVKIKLSRGHFGHTQKTNHICQDNDISKCLNVCDIYIFSDSSLCITERKRKIQKVKYFFINQMEPGWMSLHLEHNKIQSWNCHTKGWCWTKNKSGAYSCLHQKCAMNFLFLEHRECTNVFCIRSWESDFYYAATSKTK